MGFFNWHKNKTEKVKNFFGFTDYQIMWIAFIKGLIIGGIAVYYYLINA